MAGQVTALQGITPEAKLREVISYELSSMFGARINGERYNPDALVSRKGLAIYKEMMTDEQVKAVMVFKRDAITSRGWTFTFNKSSSLSQEEQETRREVLERVVDAMRGSFEDALNYIARGRTYGFSMTEKVLDNIKVNGTTYVGIHSLMPRDPASIVFYTDEYGVLQKAIQRVSGDEIELDLSRFVHYVHNPEDDAWYGQSDLRQAYRSWYVKDQIIMLYATFLERFAGGFSVISVESGAGITPNSPQHKKLETILQNLRNMTGMILPPGVTFDMKAPATTGEYREALTYFDLAIAKALLVPNLLGLSHAGQTGSFSQSQTQLEAFFWTLNADTARLEACLNEQLFMPLCDMNWGDGEYPVFAFKPASQDHVRWLVTTWKDLVGAKAVETTAEDEAHLRQLLEMPAREVDIEDEGDDALASDPQTAFTGVQITAMLEVLGLVANGTLPKETAAEVLVQSFPLSKEDAMAMLTPIEVKEPVMPAVGQLPNGQSAAVGNGEPPAKPPQQSQADGSRGEVAPPAAAVPVKESDGAVRYVVPHTDDGKPRMVSMAAFSNAVQRVDFAVIDRQAQIIADDASEVFSRLVARAVKRVLADSQRMAELLDEDVADIEHLKLDGGDVGKMKAAAKSMLDKGWVIGSQAARRELAKAGKPSKAEFKSLRTNAAGYFEANGFRMAANVSDAVRAIIQQELLAGIKGGLRPDVVAQGIFTRLVGKGFTTTRAMEQELIEAAYIGQVQAALNLTGKTNIASYLETLARTNLFEAMNEARFAEYTDPELEGFVEALEYSAILDDRTTEICQELDGMVFAADSPEWDTYKPPNHYNCRSLLIAVTETDKWDGRESNKPKVLPQDGFGAAAAAIMEGEGE